MIIVLEGIDNSGKSTLAKYLSAKFGWSVQGSEGPPKYEGEMNDRLARYVSLDNIIFDRHPVVSQEIYKTIRTGHDAAGMDPLYVRLFYASMPLFVYCDPLDRGMSEHRFSVGVDTEEHLRQVSEGYTIMLHMYREWAIAHAHFLYRIGDSMQFIGHSLAAHIPAKTPSVGGVPR